MSELKNWQEITVIRGDPELGCIPASFEWLIRHSRITGGFLDSFQEDFNLQRKGIDYNNFETISRAVKYKFPNLDISSKEFGNGEEKINFIREKTEKDIACLLSLALTERGGWHIMPLIFIDDNKIKLKDGLTIREIDTEEVIRRHDTWPGGKDVSWLERTK